MQEDKINHPFCYIPLPSHLPSSSPPVCLCYVSPWNPTLQIFLNLVASFADLILMSNLEWPTIVLKFVFVLCRLQTDKNGAFFSFCEASCHNPGSKRQNRILWITRGGLQALLLYIFSYYIFSYYTFFPQFYPCALKIACMKAISLFSCDRSHGFFSSHN